MKQQGKTCAEAIQTNEFFQQLLTSVLQAGWLWLKPPFVLIEVSFQGRLMSASSLKVYWALPKNKWRIYLGPDFWLYFLFLWVWYRPHHQSLLEKVPSYTAVPFLWQQPWHKPHCPFLPLIPLALIKWCSLTRSALSLVATWEFS